MNALKCSGLFILVIILCVSYAHVKDHVNETDCSDYGNSPFPIWSHLTEVEIATLKNADRARAGNPDALLALAIFASGDVREETSYASYRRQIISFVNSVRPAIDGKTNDKEKGRLLYAKLCGYFYGKAFWNNELSGYSYDQSKLSEMLGTRRYNCVSSTLLCLIVFRFFNLDVQGVMIPSHVFLELNAPDSGAVEIETTSRNGFDFKHTTDYFRRESGQWAKGRGLPPITAEEYRRRVLLSPFETVCNNMNNQHTSEARMAECDRDRLNEALDFLIPGNQLWQSNRLAVYNNSYIRFDAKKDSKSACRMFDKTAETISSFIDLNKNNRPMLDNIYLVQLARSIALVKNGRLAEGKNLADSVIILTDSGYKNRNVFINNACYVYGESGQSLIAARKFKETVQLYQTCPLPLRTTKQMRENIQYTYAMAIDDAFKSEKYREAIAFGIAALPYCTDEVRKQIGESIQSSYLNLSRKYSMINDRMTAERVLKECMEKSPVCGKCRERLAILH
jgi:tetratricopeptide (TPR) repeat protein